MNDTLFGGQSNKIIIFLPPDLNAPYFYYLKSILNQAKKIGVRVHVVLLENCETVHRMYWKKSLNLSQAIKLRDQYLLQFLRESSSNISIETLNIRNFRSKSKIVSFSSKLSMLEAFDSKLYNSVKSVMATDSILSWRPDYRLFFLKQRVHNHVRDFLSVHQAIDEFVVGQDEFTGIFLNGRHPTQAAVRTVLESHRIAFLSLEHGEPSLSRFHLEKFQVQELKAMQDKYLCERHLMTNDVKDLAKNFAIKWLDQQQMNKEQNIFLRDDKDRDLLKNLTNTRKLGVIYTSSVDETINNLGHDMNGWTSQSQAISAAALEFQRLGLKPIVRIHPNSENKAFIDLLDITKSLLVLGIEYILPWEDVDSYELLNFANIVCTWDSRIGLEAAARNIPTFVLGKSEYAHMSGLLEIGPMDIDQISQINLRRIHNEDVLLSLYQMKNHGHKIEDYLSQEDVHQLNLIADNFALMEMRRRKILRRLEYLFPLLNGHHSAIFNRFITPNQIIDILRYFLPREQSNKCLTKIVRFLTKTQITW